MSESKKEKVAMSYCNGLSLQKKTCGISFVFSHVS
jgi:hypothetical protein